MTPETTVTGWIEQLKAGQSAAAQKLWEGYFGKMVKLARHRLVDAPRAAADEEDVALSAFDSFCRGAQAGQFPQLLDRGTLWPLLEAITSHKLLDLRRREGRQKRGGHLRRLTAGADGELPAIEELISREPTPQFACQMAEEFRRLLDTLADDTLRNIAVARLEGHTVEEIAEHLSCVPRTVLRKLERIRTLWSDGADG